uniref:DUF3615 domain-containing protein n=1 Tax=Oryza brachyantha TaxID=4533 RepID=J3N9W5_ORYBR
MDPCMHMQFIHGCFYMESDEYVSNLGWLLQVLGLAALPFEPFHIQNAISMSEKIREYEEYLKEHTFDSLEETFEYFHTEKYEAEKNWMSEEVMVAFEKHIARRDDLKEFDYQFDELLFHCFNVEIYHKTFHHFNFTVRMRAPCSTDWTSTLYFAEVMELLGHQKSYFCSPLEPNENVNCYAFKNQGMEDLKHPVVGAFDRGSPDLSLVAQMTKLGSNDHEGYYS